MDPHASKPDMSDEGTDSKRGKSQGNPTLFFVMLGVIVLLLLVFLFLRPRGSEAGPQQDTHHAQ